MLKIKGLKKSFGTTEVLKGIDFDVHEGEIVAIIGPSGSGKSTLLRSINFLESADYGEMTFSNQTIDMQRVKRAQKVQIRQKAAMVFQAYHLFKNKTALENVMEGLLVRPGANRKESEAKALECLENVGLLAFKDQMPSQLSGGQQQRVGIARAMALGPEMILFDEPTSALDPELVGEVLSVIRNLGKTKTTMIIVTHEMEFAKEIADRVIFMDNGKIAASGTAQAMFDTPESDRLRAFLNRMA